MTSKINVLQVIPKLGYGGAETGCYDIWRRKIVAHLLLHQEEIYLNLSKKIKLEFLGYLFIAKTLF